jgi:hypothetical protein
MLNQNSEKISTHSKIIVQQLNHMSAPKKFSILRKKILRTFPNYCPTTKSYASTNKILCSKESRNSDILHCFIIVNISQENFLLVITEKISTANYNILSIETTQTYSYSSSNIDFPPELQLFVEEDINMTPCNRIEC